MRATRPFAISPAYAAAPDIGGYGGATLDDPLTAATEPESQPIRRRRTRLDRVGNQSLPFVVVGGLIGLLLLLYLWNGIIVIIRPGEAGALYRPFTSGTVTDYVFPEGIHILWPWNKMYVYNVRVQTVRREFKVLTNKGLPIFLSLAIRFYPEYELVGLLHKRVGPDYIDTIVVPQVESVLRRNIGRQDPEDIYTNKEGILTSIIVKAIEEAGQKFVFIDDIIIRSVTLPDEVRNAIAAKLVEQQRWKSYEFILARERQEVERKKTEANGIREYQRIIGETLDDRQLQWQGIKATLELAQSNNSKVVVIGSGERGLPIILGLGDTPPPPEGPKQVTVNVEPTESGGGASAPGPEAGSPETEPAQPEVTPASADAGATR